LLSEETGGHNSHGLIATLRNGLLNSEIFYSLIEPQIVIQRRQAIFVAELLVSGVVGIQRVRINA
jgi:hypothetical protein